MSELIIVNRKVVTRSGRDTRSGKFDTAGRWTYVLCYYCYSLEQMSLPRLVKTSAPSALARRASATRDPLSTVWSPTSCSKEVTSQTTMVLVASPSTVRSSETRTSSWSTPDLESCRWPMLVPTPMDPSSSSPPWRLLGWTADTLSLALLLKAWMLSSRLNPMAPSLARPQRKSSLLTAVNSPNLIL